LVVGVSVAPPASPAKLWGRPRDRAEPPAAQTVAIGLARCQSLPLTHTHSSEAQICGAGLDLLGKKIKANYPTIVVPDARSRRTEHDRHPYGDCLLVVELSANAVSSLAHRFLESLCVLKGT
jgi:hypothetical protein